MVDKVNSKRYERNKNMMKRFLPEGWGLDIVDYDFTNHRPNYGGFRLTVSQKLEADLEAEINRDLSSNSGGVRAVLRAIGLKEYGGGKTEYQFEVYPLEEVPEEDFEVVTQEYFQKLPSALKNFRQRHYHRE